MTDDAHKPPFDGFSPGQHRMIPVPAQFFSELLPLIDDLAEMKVTLFCFQALQQREGHFRYVQRQDFYKSDALMQSLNALTDPENSLDHVLDAALQKAIARGTLLTTTVSLGDEPIDLYFMNTARGRTAIAQIERGQWRPSADELRIQILPERPNIFTVYEQNIGPLTAMIRDELIDAEQTYAYDWLIEAIKLAVENNARSWRYVMTILKRWQEEGRLTDETTQRDRGTDGKKYKTGKYAKFIDS